jgi:hypothetical protein
VAGVRQGGIYGMVNCLGAVGFVSLSLGVQVTILFNLY